MVEMSHKYIPKIHRDNVPLRRIASSVGSPSYDMTKFIAFVLINRWFPTLQYTHTTSLRRTLPQPTPHTTSTYAAHYLYLRHTLPPPTPHTTSTYAAHYLYLRRILPLPTPHTTSTYAAHYLYLRRTLPLPTSHTTSTYAAHYLYLHRTLPPIQIEMN